MKSKMKSSSKAASLKAMHNPVSSVMPVKMMPTNSDMASNTALNEKRAMVSKMNMKGRC